MSNQVTNIFFFFFLYVRYLVDNETRKLKFFLERDGVILVIASLVESLFGERIIIYYGIG